VSFPRRVLAFSRASWELAREIRETQFVAHRSSFAVCAVCAVTALFVGLSIVGAGCAAQGEGDRCTYFQGGAAAANPDINGTSECQGGLICWRGTSGFNPSTGTYDRCCPPVPVPGDTVAACEQVTQGSGTPTAGADASFDVTSEAATVTDSGSDAASDAKEHSDAKASSDAKHSSDAEEKGDAASDASDEADAPSDGSSSEDSG
jgi:hypothetical protein